MDTQEYKELTNYIFTFDITTRWIDNDMFGHVNNVNYYAFFDSIINQFLIEQGGFNPQTSKQIGFIVDSSCQYFSPVAYPDKLIGAVRVNRIGNSSVEYGVALFKKGQSIASAAGKMTHVFVERESHKPSAIEDTMRHAMKRAMVDIKTDDVSI